MANTLILEREVIYKMKIKLFIVAFIFSIIMLPQVVFSQTNGNDVVLKAFKSSISGELYFATLTIKYLGKGFEAGVYDKTQVAKYISITNKLLKNISKVFNQATIEQNSRFGQYIEDVLDLLKSASSKLESYINDASEENKVQFTKKIVNLEYVIGKVITSSNKMDGEIYDISELLSGLKSSISGYLYFAYMSIGAIADCSLVNGSKENIASLIERLDDVKTCLKSSLNDYDDYNGQDKKFIDEAVKTFDLLKDMLKNQNNNDAFQNIREKVWEKIGNLLR